jgi:two-component system chemotaxis sensor kinase CheA
MSSDLAALWREFEAETDDHLETLERLLTVSRDGQRSGEEISALFRAFHSLKGSFALMGMPHVEAVAHRSEDILALVREGHAPLDNDLQKLLLDAVDRLKEMRDVVMTKRTDAPAARKLIERLEDYRNRIARPQKVIQPPGPERPASLGSDPEMLAIFSELLEQRLPELALALSTNVEQQRLSSEAASDLANAAEVLGFDALAGALKTIAACSSGVWAGGRSELIERFNEIRVQISLIEDATEAPSGGRALAAALRTELGADYREALSRLSEALSMNSNDQAATLAAAALSRALANCVDFQHAVRLLVLLEEQQSRLSTGELSDCPQLAEIADKLVGLVSEAAGVSQDVESSVCTSMSQLWHDVLGTSPISHPDGPASTGYSPVLRPEFRATLSAEQIARIEQAMAGGKRAFEILVDLESDPEISANILSWLTSAVEAVTSRTVFRDGKSYFEFLVLSAETSEWLQAQLKELDPERLCIEEAREALGEETAPSPLSPAAIPTARTSGYVRVRSDVIDRLMAEVGEMRSVLAALSDGVQNGHGVRAIASLRLTIDQLNPATASDLRAKVEAVEHHYRDLGSLETKLEAAHRRIWEAGLQLRVVPVDALFTRLARAVRDLSERLEKPVDVRVEGTDVRIDKRIVDALVDPLMHMVRNAVDHGIEGAEQRTAAGKPARAQVQISAIERSNKVQLIIADDGKGLDKPRILAKAIELGLINAGDAEHISQDEICRLLLRPGFSTADTVTELSGRGVGMDVVANAVQKLGGSIDLQTNEGIGTSFILTIPLSASLLRSLLVSVEDHIFAIPERQIVGVAELEPEEIETIGDDRFCAYRDLMIPVHSLGPLLGLAESKGSTGRAEMVIVSPGTETIALEVDRIWRFQDLFLKELHPILADVPAIGGASVLGDGRPVLVLDVPGLTSFGVSQGVTPARTPALST